MKNYSIRTVGVGNYLRLAPESLVKNIIGVIAKYYHIIVIVVVLYLMFRSLVSE